VTLFLLFAAHGLCDYPLQGDFLARGKNHKLPLPGVPWYQCLIAHSFIHAGAVALILGSLGLGIAELAAHFAIDFSKSAGYFGTNPIRAFNIDQACHIVCKLGWFAAWLATHA
jgi:hypothetical protein